MKLIIITEFATLATQLNVNNAKILIHNVLLVMITSIYIKMFAIIAIKIIYIVLLKNIIFLEQHAKIMNMLLLK